MTTLNRLLTNRTEVATVFVNNYPQYSKWTAEAIPVVHERLAVSRDGEYGMYVHIPFCRERCEFCWYKVFNVADEAASFKAYQDALLRELELWLNQPAFAGRPLSHIHFGGGTPSLLSTKQLRVLLPAMQSIVPWDEVREITVECEPGTLDHKKLQTLKECGVTRISLGLETFNNNLLTISRRKHTAADSERVYLEARGFGFDQVSFDLLIGMREETEESWKETLKRAIDLAPDGVSLYQMEVPSNTILAKKSGPGRGLSLASWSNKLKWVRQGFEAFMDAGYEITDSRSLVKKEKRNSISPSRYQDGLNTGLDTLSIGASPFGLIGDVQYQNEKGLDLYLGLVQNDTLPIKRGVVMDDRTRFIRELVLQFKTGRIDLNGFVDKFGLNPANEFAGPIDKLVEAGFVEVCGDTSIKLTLEGILQADRLVPLFYEKE